jgi:hypothetical protein
LHCNYQISAVAALKWSGGKNDQLEEEKSKHEARLL